jgi:hypothetical protein
MASRKAVNGAPSRAIRQVTVNCHSSSKQVTVFTTRRDGLTYIDVSGCLSTAERATDMSKPKLLPS